MNTLAIAWVLMASPGITDMDVENRSTPVMEPTTSLAQCESMVKVMEVNEPTYHFWCATYTGE